MIPALPTIVAVRLWDYESKGLKWKPAFFLGWANETDEDGTDTVALIEIDDGGKNRVSSVKPRDVRFFRPKDLEAFVEQMNN